MPFIGPKPADTVLDSTLIADGSITSAKIADGTIVNADLNSSAAIATSKITGLAASATTDTTNAANIASGVIADARISASSVQQHATSFDDNKILNDISTLGLRVHTQENLNASNSNSASFDVFQDSSGITNLTNVSRDTNEYVASVSGIALPTNTKLYVSSKDKSNGDTSFSDASTSSHSLSVGGTVTHSNGATKMDGASTSILFGTDGELNGSASTDFDYGTGDFYIGFWYKPNSTSSWNTGQKFIVHGGHGAAYDYNGWSFQALGQGSNETRLKAHAGNNSHPSGGGSWSFQGGHASNVSGGTDWRHYAWGRTGSTMGMWVNGNPITMNFNTGSHTTAINDGDRALKIGAASDGTNHVTGYMDDIIVIKGTGGETAGSSFTPRTQYLGLTANATGSFEGNTITAPSSVSKMGAVITYQDNAGTNALNTDIVLQLSADGGSNYSTATLTALPDFATGIKMAKVNDLSVTAGTSLKYKISFANQASGSKEARIRGVSLQY